MRRDLGTISRPPAPNIYNIIGIWAASQENLSLGFATS